eukprot:5188668-Pyramimonas_sp.AAC.1
MAKPLAVHVIFEAVGGSSAPHRVLKGLARHVRATLNFVREITRQRSQGLDELTSAPPRLLPVERPPRCSRPSRGR